MERDTSLTASTEPNFRLRFASTSSPNATPLRGEYVLTGKIRANLIERSRVPNMMKRVCVAARIGDGKAPGEGNSHSLAKTSNEASADSGCNPSGWREFWPMALSKVPCLE